MGYKQTKKQTIKTNTTKITDGGAQRHILIHINCMVAYNNFLKKTATLFLEEMEECDNDGDLIQYGTLINYINNLIALEENHIRWTNKCIASDYKFNPKLAKAYMKHDFVDTKYKEKFEEWVEEFGKDPIMYLEFVRQEEVNSEKQFEDMVEADFPHYKHEVHITTHHPDLYKQYGAFLNAAPDGIELE